MTRLVCRSAPLPKKHWHLPAVLPSRFTASHLAFRLVSACGRRGPIRARDDFEPKQGELIGVPVAYPVCPGCAVVWDKAEQEGRLLIAFTSSGLREWRGASWCGATPPYRRSKMSYHSDGTPKDLRIQVFRRTETAPRLSA